MFDSLIHLQDSQTSLSGASIYYLFDSLIHLQDSQTTLHRQWWTQSLIHLFTYKTLKHLMLQNTVIWVWFTYSLTRLSNEDESKKEGVIVWFTYSLTRLSNKRPDAKTDSTFDSLIHLQDSQTVINGMLSDCAFDSLIHLQDSQTRRLHSYQLIRLIHLFTYKTLKPTVCNNIERCCLIHLFTYKTLKLCSLTKSERLSLIHLFTYKTLKPNRCICTI